MSEEKTAPPSLRKVSEAITFIVQMSCTDGCEGKMTANGHQTQGREPVLFTHVCNKCQRVAQFAERYPSPQIFARDEPLPPEFAAVVAKAAEVPAEKKLEGGE